MPISGRPYPFTATIALAGPAVVVDLHVNLGLPANTFNLVCDGPGNLSLEISNDGTNYSAPYIIAPGDGPFDWDPPETARPQDRDRMKVSRIRLDRVGANAVTYRGIAV